MACPKIRNEFQVQGWLVDETASTITCEDDILCEPCQEGRINLVSTHFCVMCQKYFCPQCERIHAVDHRNEGIIRKKGLCECRVTCCVQHVDGTIMVIDEMNKKLKRVHNETGKVLNMCQFVETPHRVCSVDMHELAVTLDTRQVQFLALLNNLVFLKNKITLKHACLAIDYADNKLYIADNDTIYIHNKDGSLLHKLSKFGRNFISDIRNLIVSILGERLFFTDYKSGVYVIDSKGNVLSQYSGSELTGVCGLSPAGCSGFLVAGFDSNNFMQFDVDGKKKGEAVSLGASVKKVVDICFDMNLMKMWIAQEKSDVVSILDLVHQSTNNN